MPIHENAKEDFICQHDVKQTNYSVNVKLLHAGKALGNSTDCLIEALMQDYYLKIILVSLTEAEHDTRTKRDRYIVQVIENCLLVDVVVVSLIFIVKNVVCDNFNFKRVVAEDVH